MTLVYTVADIHGRPDRLEMVRANVLKYQPDVLVTAGDITSFSRQAHSVLDEVDLMPAPVLAVRGNSDFAKVGRLLADRNNITDLHLKKVTAAGLDFVGLGGTVPVPFRNRVALREKALFERAAGLVDGETVLVAHLPPFGVLDEVFGRFHSGSRRLTRLVESRRPRLLICGHIHERPGAAFLGETLVVNCSLGQSGEGALVEVSDGRPIKAEMLQA